MPRFFSHLPTFSVTCKDCKALQGCSPDFRGPGAKAGRNSQPRKLYSRVGHSSARQDGRLGSLAPIVFVLCQSTIPSAHNFWRGYLGQLFLVLHRQSFIQESQSLCGLSKPRATICRPGALDCGVVGAGDILSCCCILPSSLGLVRYLILW